MNLRKVGQAFAGLSFALGAGELLAGKRLARSMGVPQHSGIVRAFGVRELAAGAALAAKPASSTNMWGRVIGDLIDLAALAAVLRTGSARNKVAWGGLAFVGGALLADLAAAVAMQRRETV